MKAGSSCGRKMRGGSKKTSPCGTMGGGSCASDHVMNDVKNLTEMPEVKGGSAWGNLFGKKSKKTKARKMVKGKKMTKKRPISKKTKKGRKGAKKNNTMRRKMNGGGVANLMGCGPVNNASTFENPGCDKETILNPPNLGEAGSGLAELSGLAGLKA